PSPPDTKDYPCTIAMWFGFNGPVLNMFVFMRSSDVWLGLPYDIFNFSMVAYLVCGHLNRAREEDRSAIIPGFLYLTAASSHLYEENLEAARATLETADRRSVGRAARPSELWGNPDALLEYLKQLRDTR